MIERAPDHAPVEMSPTCPGRRGKSTVAARYQYERLPGDIYRVRFGLVHGDMKQYLGSLYIEPWAPGRAAITYELVAQPSLYAPHSVINRGVRRSAGNFVHALRQRINDLHRLGYLHPELPQRLVRSPLVGRPPAAPSDGSGLQSASR